jgi:hypothetical protein
LVRAAWNLFRYASCASDIEESILRTSRGLFIDTDTIHESGSIRTLRSNERGTRLSVEVLTVRTDRRALGYANVVLQKISRPTLGNPFKNTVIATWDSSALAIRGLGRNTEAVFQLISLIARWGGVEDTLVSNARAAIRADGSTQRTPLAIKLCARGTTFHMPRSLVGGGHNVIEGILSEGSLARGNELSMRDRNGK